MESISQPIRSAEGAAEYFTHEDYYVNRAEKPGYWKEGKASHFLGLMGWVEREIFKFLLNGFSRDGLKNLVQNAGSSRRQKAWDICLSAPKEVSILWCLGSKELREAIEKAHDRAVHAALDYIEENAGVSRRGNQGKLIEKVALLFAIFQHGASRALDPQLHSHAILVNVGVREDGSTGALRSIDFFRAKMATGAIYQAELAWGLRQLGFKIEPDKVAFKVKGVPQDLCDLFSKRRKEIVEAMKQKGAEGAVAAKAATLATRQRKQAVNTEDLFTRWRETAKAYGWGLEQVQRLISSEKPQEIDRKKFDEAFKKAANRVFAEKKTPERLASIGRKLAIEYGASAEDVKEAVEKNLPKKKGFIRVEWKELFPKAPSLNGWNPAKKLKAPVVKIGKDQAFRRWGEIKWRKDLIVGELRRQRMILFPNAAWSPLRKLTLPAFRLVERPAHLKPQLGEITSKIDLKIAKLHIHKMHLFPAAKEGSFASKLNVRAVRLAANPKTKQQTNTQQH